MPKYDPFGREIGEDTLAGLRAEPAAPQAEPEADPVPPPAEPADAPPRPEPQFAAPPRVKVRRSGGLGCFIALLILAAVAVGPIIAVVSFVDQAEDAFDGVTGVIDELPTIDPGDISEAPEAPAPPPAGIAGRSMIAPANFAPVLRRLRADGVPAVVDIRLSADRAAVQTYRRGRTRRVTYRYDGEVERGTRGRAFDALGNIPLRALDPRAPVRLVRGSARRYGVRERRIDYLIARAEPADGTHVWIAYFKNGTYVYGDARGRVIRRIN